MSDIDRRTMIALAGAGLVLAGCDSQSDGNSIATGEGEGETTSTAGACRLFGQSVRTPGPLDEHGKPTGSVTAFAPDKICVVLIRFDAGGQMTTRRTYIAMPQPAQLITAIWETLGKLSSGTAVNATDRDHIDPIALVGHRLLVIYIDNDPRIIRFKFHREPVDLTKEEKSYAYTLRFAPYRGSDPEHKTKPNHAFFNVKKITFPGVILPKANTAFTLEYWDTDGSGHPVKDVEMDEADTHFIYSLNILIESKVESSAGPKWVPLIIDPDTGNGGAEP
jgi:hypothetical protein